MPIKILMPALSPTMSEGNLVKWHKAEGEHVATGDILAEIETDKATMEVEAVDEGILARILVSEGTENVKVNTLIAVLLEEGEDESALGDHTDPASSSQPLQQNTSEIASDTVQINNEISQSPVSKLSSRVHASPLARRLAETHQIDLHVIPATGPHGRIIKVDVEKCIASQQQNGACVIPEKKNAQITSAKVQASSPPSEYDEVKLSGMRKTIAKRLTESKQTVPHFYLNVECELDALLALRKQINATLDENERISVNDFMIKASALALKAEPAANVSYHESHLRQYHSSDIAVAVAIDGGLVTPVVHGAHHKSLRDISSQAKALIQKARAGKLLPEEYQNGTFSLSNLGMYGVQSFHAIVNPPQGCILAVGAGVQKPMVKNGQIVIATTMICTLSVDHRVIDGSVGANFLKHFKRLIENPLLIIL